MDPREVELRRTLDAACAATKRRWTPEWDRYEAALKALQDFLCEHPAVAEEVAS